MHCNVHSRVRENMENLVVCRLQTGRLRHYGQVDSQNTCSVHSKTKVKYSPNMLSALGAYGQMDSLTVLSALGAYGQMDSQTVHLSNLVRHQSLNHSYLYRTAPRRRG